MSEETDREICILLLKWEQRFNYELDRLDPGNISHQRPFLKTMIKNTIEDLQAEIEQLKVELDKARRLACKAQTHNHPTGYTKEEYAKNQGWDCFEDQGDE